ncbi:hypothetical protein GNP80_08920 [Aliivibrio fischeri]|nr:hypothetical protein [Aliivibrio fischeri]
MSNAEEFLFIQHLEFLQERFVNASKEEQQEIIKQLEPVAKKQGLITVYRPQHEILADLREAIELGGDRARDFFTHSFVSWYRRGHDIKSMLGDWDYLDRSNRYLFLEMIAIRDLYKHSDSELYEFEQYCLSKMKD